MNDYLNKTSLRFILVFLLIIALSVGLLEVLNRLEGNSNDGSTELQRAEPGIGGAIPEE